MMGAKIQKYFQEFFNFKKITEGSRDLAQMLPGRLLLYQSV